MKRPPQEWNYPIYLVRDFEQRDPLIAQTEQTGPALLLFSRFHHAQTYCREMHEIDSRNRFTISVLKDAQAFGDFLICLEYPVQAIVWDASLHAGAYWVTELPLPPSNSSFNTGNDSSSDVLLSDRDTSHPAQSDTQLSI